MAEEGPHEELLGEGGVYAELYRIQFGERRNLDSAEGLMKRNVPWRPATLHGAARRCRRADPRGDRQAPQSRSASRCSSSRTRRCSKRSSRAQQRGVKVRVMLNPARRSGEEDNEPTRKKLLRAGVEVIDSNPAFDADAREVDGRRRRGRRS